MRKLWLLSLLLWGCSNSTPTAPVDPLAQDSLTVMIQARLTGQVAYMQDGAAQVEWQLRADGYRLEVHTDRLVQWEQGNWWVGNDRGQVYLLLDRLDGATYAPRTDSWTPASSYRYPLPLMLLGRSLDEPALQVRLGNYTFHLKPLETERG